MDAGCFHLLSVVSGTAVNMGVHISLQDPAFSSFAYMPGSKTLDQMIIQFLTFLRSTIAAVQFYIPSSSA